MIRAFIGIEVNQETRGSLGAEIARLQPLFPAIRWVDPDNLHLTLKFVGNVPTAEIADVFAAADEAAAEAEPFGLDVRGLGCFPDARRPRIAWAGCGEGAAETAELMRRVEDTCERLGYPRERKGSVPHVTLGRVKHPADASGLGEEMTASPPRSYGLVDVDEIVVFMSELKRSGAIYTAMHRAPLG